MKRFVLLCAVLLTFACEWRALQFTVVFNDAKNLKAGDPLVYRGTAIGEVKTVGLSGDQVRVLVEVGREHRTRVYREAEFLIEKQGGLLDTSGKMQLTMNDRGEARSQIQRADVLQGSEGIVDRIREGAGMIAKEALKKLVQ